MHIFYKIKSPVVILAILLIMGLWDNMLSPSETKHVFVYLYNILLKHNYPIKNVHSQHNTLLNKVKRHYYNSDIRILMKA